MLDATWGCAASFCCATCTGGASTFGFSEEQPKEIDNKVKQRARGIQFSIFVFISGSSFANRRKDALERKLAGSEESGELPLYRSQRRPIEIRRTLSGPI